MFLKKTSEGFSLLELDSESELREVCAKRKALLLGGLIESKKKYYTVEFEYLGATKAIGIINGGHGIIPSIVLLQEQNLIIIASDQTIFFIDLVENQISNQILCDSLIYEIHYDNLKSKEFLVICELGVIRILFKGTMVWKYDCDVIENYKIYNNTIELFVDGERISLSKITGKEIDM